jgi:hypothetical protein
MPSTRFDHYGSRSLTTLATANSALRTISLWRLPLPHLTLHPRQCASYNIPRLFERRLPGHLRVGQLPMVPTPPATAAVAAKFVKELAGHMLKSRPHRQA